MGEATALLSVSVLADYSGDDAFAKEFKLALCYRVFSQLTSDVWAITEEEITAVLRQYEKELLFAIEHPIHESDSMEGLQRRVSMIRLLLKENT